MKLLPEEKMDKIKEHGETDHDQDCERFDIGRGIAAFECADARWLAVGSADARSGHLDLVVDDGLADDGRDGGGVGAVADPLYPSKGAGLRACARMG